MLGQGWPHRWRDIWESGKIIEIGVTNLRLEWKGVFGDGMSLLALVRQGKGSHILYVTDFRYLEREHTLKGIIRGI